MKKQRILFTGEAGQLAVKITEALQGSADVEVIQDVSAWQTHPSGHHGWPEVDIRNGETVEAAIAHLQPDIVIHSAAVVNTDKCIYNPQNSINVNLLGTHNVLQACGKHNAKLVYFSTTATYNPAPHIRRPYSESTLQRPPTLYGITKYAGELLVTGQHLVPWVVVRPCFVYGNPPLDHSSQLCRVAVHQVLKSLGHPDVGPTPLVTLDPKSVKDYMRVEDFAQAVAELLSLETPWGHYFNIAGESPREMGEYFRVLEEELKLGPLDMQWKPGADYMGDHRVNASFLKACTGWKPKIPWRTGVAMTAAAAKEYVNDVNRGVKPLLYK